MLGSDDKEKIKRLRYFLDNWDKKAKKSQDVMISVRESEFLLVFCDIDKNIFNIKGHGGFRMSIKTAKYLHALLSDRISRYEAEHGEVSLD